MDFAPLAASAEPIEGDGTRDPTGILHSTTLSPGHIHQLQQQAQQSLADYTSNNPSTMFIDPCRSEAAVGGGGGEAGGNDSGSSAMELDDFSGLFGLSELGLPPGHLSSLPPLPPLQGSSTITPSQIAASSTATTLPLGIETMPSATDLLDLQYPFPDSIDKPFGSLSDFQAMALEGEFPHSGRSRVMGERTVSDMDTSFAQQIGLPNLVNAFSSSESPRHHRRHHEHSLGSYRSPNVSTSESSRGPARMNRSTANSTTSSVYLPSSVDLVPSSFSPILLDHYDNQGRILADASGSVKGSGAAAADGNVSSGDVGGLSFVLSGLGGLGPNSNGGNDTSPVHNGFRLRDYKTRAVNSASGVGIEPTTIMRRAGSAVTFPAHARSTPNSGSSRRGSSRNSTHQQFANVSIPLPLPTRSRPPSAMLRGWTGEERTTSAFSQDSSTTRPETISTAALQGIQAEATRKRKREPESDSDHDDDEERRRSASLRREMLGLRVIKSNSTTNEDDSSRQERERKRRRVGSLSISAMNKGKAKEIKQESDEESFESDSSDGSDGDAYYPSRSSSPALGNPGPSSRHSSKAISRIESGTSAGTGITNRRSESVGTLATTTTSMSPHNEEENGKENLRKKIKGKAKGSAALALAKVTMLSGKPPTSPWGTYVPFPVDEEEDIPETYPPEDTEIRQGRKRRNGHIPLPVPVPHLIKKSRGRKVPYVAKEVAEGSSPNKRRDSDEWKRMFVCEVAGCGKCFVRGEHLKRHVRSIHTHDKPHPCPYEGCDKTFSRRDNLGQHVRIHLPNSK